MSRSAGAEETTREVVPVELFFDLVFVFALSQLTRHLLDRLTWRGAAETCVLLCGVFGVWAYTSFQATVLGPERAAAQRALLAIMFVGLLMNAAIGDAFDSSPWTFVGPLLLIQFGYGFLTARTAAEPGFNEHFRRVLWWFAATAPLWLVGAGLHPTVRLACWSAAAAIDVAGTWLAHPLPRRVLHSTQLRFDSSHMIERLRLFLIIALGEAVVTTGGAIAGEPSRLSTLAAGVGGLGAVVGLWAAFFGGANSYVRAHVAHTRDPVRSARLGINVMYVALAGLIALAVANELVIASPGHAGSWTLGLLLFGGPLLYLGSQDWHVTTTSHAMTRWLWLIYAALVAGGLTARVVPRWSSLALLLVVLAAAVALLRSQPASRRSRATRSAI